MTVFNHLEEEYLQDDNHSNFIVTKASKINNVQNTNSFDDSLAYEFEQIENQGRTQEHLNRNNETMLFSLCGILFLFVSYGLYLLFK